MIAPQFVNGEWQIVWGTRIIKKKFGTEMAAIAHQMAIDGGYIVPEYEPILRYGRKTVRVGQTARFKIESY
jgi:hypothetical protein